MVVLRFRLEVSGSGEAYWSARSPQVPSLLAESPRLMDCQRLAIDVLDAVDVDTSEVVYELVG